MRQAQEDAYAKEDMIPGFPIRLSHTAFVKVRLTSRMSDTWCFMTSRGQFERAGDFSRVCGLGRSIFRGGYAVLVEREAPPKSLLQKEFLIHLRT